MMQLKKIKNKKEPAISPGKQRNSPGYHAPRKGVARYPWTVAILLLIVIAVIYTVITYLHVNQLVPIAPPSCLSFAAHLKDTSPAPSKATIAATQHTYNTAPSMCIDVNKVYYAGINTNKGLIVIELDPKLAPKTVNNFIFLAQRHFYDGLTFHRVVNDASLHIIQTGDPLGNGTGGPGYSFPDEPVQGTYTEGTVAMANSGPNTNGSQFFICTGDDSSLAASYNIFGHVVQGIQVAQSIQGPGDAANTKNIPPDIINHVVVEVGKQVL